MYNGPFVVLDDKSTYSGASGCLLVYLRSDAASELAETNDFDDIIFTDDNSIVISMDDLLDAYNKVHGTDH
jgi:hypothetical protein